MIDIKMFLMGWKRRSAIIMDNAGSPIWLTKWRCPTLRGWGTLLIELTGGEPDDDA